MKKEEVKEIFKNAKFIFNYYNGSMISGKEDYKVITIADDYIEINKTGKKDEKLMPELTKEVTNYSLSNIDMIKRMSKRNEKAEHHNDSTSDTIAFRYKNKEYFISNKAHDTEINTFYSNFMKEIFNILKKYKIEL